ncbi:MAG: GAF domain-containing protein, partial [Terriglobales bacterium]
MALGKLIEHDYSSFWLYDPTVRQLRLHALDFPTGKGLIREGIVIKVAGSPAGEAYTGRRAFIVAHLDDKQFPNEATRWLLDEGIRSICLVPLSCGGRCTGVLALGSRR